MSYWFGEPHTLVLARARIDLRNPRKRIDPRAKSEATFAERALVPMLLAVRTEMLLRL
jgi:hypothetical protein